MAALVPKGRVRRLIKVARAGASAGAGAVLGGRSESAVSDVMVHHAAELLGELRGLAAKAGQMASYVDGFVPEAHRAVFERAMGGLQAAAPASPPKEVRSSVERELGGRLSEHFRYWEEVPFASASIGQVHRAELHDGTRVAVKVQHPGVAEAVEQDLRNASVVEGLVSRLGPKGINAHAVLGEVSARFREELDYHQEARHLLEFRALHQADSSVQIPKVFPEHSGRRVLTCLYCGGESLAQASRLPAPFREHYAETLWRFFFRSILGGSAFNADPHPGNYLFTKDSKVVFLDFGCVQRFDALRRQSYQDICEAALDRDSAAFAAAAAAWFGARGGEYERGAVRFMENSLRPLSDSPFRVDSTFARHVVEGVQTFKQLMFSRDGSFVEFPPQTVLLNRLQFGFYSVLACLDVEVDVAGVLEGVLAELED